MSRSRAVWLALGLWAAGCSAAVREPGPLPPGLEGTSWRAATITGLPVLAEVASTLSFLGPDRVGGSAGCNRYSGPLTVERGELRIGPLLSTRMACAPPMMEQERRFTTALEQGVRFERDGQALLLHSAGRAGPTRFAPASAPAAPVP